LRAVQSQPPVAGTHWRLVRLSDSSLILSSQTKPSGQVSLSPQAREHVRCPLTSVRQ
jgi:hypothetical protein